MAATATRRTGDDETRAVSLAGELAERGVSGIALTYVDNSGVTRVKAIPTSRLAKATASGVGMSPVFDVFLLDDSITTSETSTGPVGDLRLYPVLDRVASPSCTSSAPSTSGPVSTRCSSHSSPSRSGARRSSPGRPR